MNEDQHIEIVLRWKEFEKKIRGDINTVIKETIKFLSSVYPNIELLSKITLNIDIEKFISNCEGIFLSTPEGIVIIADTLDLSDRDLLILHLTKARFSYYLNKTDKDSLFINDILSTTKKSAGTIAGRLSEMCSEGLAERIGKGEYRSTTYGIHYFLTNIANQLRRKET